MLSDGVLAVGCVTPGGFSYKQMVRRHCMCPLPAFEMMFEVILSQGDS